jgi:hypothetical protein
MKNELILARFTGQRKHSAGQRLQALLQEFALEPLLATRYPALVAAPTAQAATAATTAVPATDQAPTLPDSAGLQGGLQPHVG